DRQPVHTDRRPDHTDKRPAHKIPRFVAIDWPPLFLAWGSYRPHMGNLPLSAAQNSPARSDAPVALA
ncbi:MAG: hypothetical protein RPU34_12475, partial [Candidatus Sedimenticola sp. (ex Thyasira tokunagai)]